jgi:hypothetical protein
MDGACQTEPDGMLAPPRYALRSHTGTSGRRSSGQRATSGSRSSSQCTAQTREVAVDALQSPIVHRSVPQQRSTWSATESPSCTSSDDVDADIPWTLHRASHAEERAGSGVCVLSGQAASGRGLKEAWVALRNAVLGGEAPVAVLAIGCMDKPAEP